jgi:hypothetical protein
MIRSCTKIATFGYGASSGITRSRTLLVPKLGSPFCAYSLFPESLSYLRVGL